jgi:hypothetical protein
MSKTPTKEAAPAPLAGVVPAGVLVWYPVATAEATYTGANPGGVWYGKMCRLYPANISAITPHG